MCPPAPLCKLLRPKRRIADAPCNACWRSGPMKSMMQAGRRARALSRSCGRRYEPNGCVASPDIGPMTWRVTSACLPPIAPNARRLQTTAALLVAPGPQSHPLCELRTGLGIVLSDHWIIMRKAPLLAILLRRQVVVRPQMTFQGFEFLPTIEAG